MLANLNDARFILQMPADELQWKGDRLVAPVTDDAQSLCGTVGSDEMAATFMLFCSIKQNRKAIADFAGTYGGLHGSDDWGTFKDWAQEINELGRMIALSTDVIARNMEQLRTAVRDDAPPQTDDELIADAMNYLFTRINTKLVRGVVLYVDDPGQFAVGIQSINALVWAQLGNALILKQLSICEHCRGIDFKGDGDCRHNVTRIH